MVNQSLCWNRREKHTLIFAINTLNCYTVQQLCQLHVLLTADRQRSLSKFIFNSLHPELKDSCPQLLFYLVILLFNHECRTIHCYLKVDQHLFHKRIISFWTQSSPHYWVNVQSLNLNNQSLNLVPFVFGDISTKTQYSCTEIIIHLMIIVPSDHFCLNQPWNPQKLQWVLVFPVFKVFSVLLNKLRRVSLQL